jgi:hypothetical protein
MAQGILDKITKQAGEGIDALINGIINKVDRALVACVGLTATATEPSQEKSKVGGVVSWLTGLMTSEPPVTIDAGQKLGGNVMKQAMYVEDNSPHASNHNEIRPPVLPMQAARSSGMGMNA